MIKNIQYPYIPEGKVIQYVNIQNQHMALAKFVAKILSLDKVMPGGAVIIQDNKAIGCAGNGSEHHKDRECRRVALKCKTGEGYELCEGCHPKNHSEAKAIAVAIKNGADTNGADLYLWGHWWCCKSCWNAMIKAGIKNVFLLENSEVLFDKDHPDNIIGKQLKD